MEQVSEQPTFPPTIIIDRHTALDAERAAFVRKLLEAYETVEMAALVVDHHLYVDGVGKFRLLLLAKPGLSGGWEASFAHYLSRERFRQLALRQIDPDGHYSSFNARALSIYQREKARRQTEHEQEQNQLKQQSIEKEEPHQREQSSPTAALAELDKQTAKLVRRQGEIELRVARGAKDEQGRSYLTTAKVSQKATIYSRTGQEGTFYFALFDGGTKSQPRWNLTHTLSGMQMQIFKTRREALRLVYLWLTEPGLDWNFREER